MTPTKVYTAVAAAFVLFICSLSFFTVQEGSAALILRLGKIVTLNKAGEPDVLRPGFHAKIPFIDTIRVFSRHLI
jgi:regulator of protease activity HflC (stomatin/prohibitin superfamily)